jgi:glycosyltransferase involved in cell wall biosynthesis
MKVVVAHNSYQLLGGEDMVVQAEVALLRAQGHVVEMFECHNDAITTIPKVKLAMQTIWSTSSAHRIDALLTRFAPDVVHVHNTFPLISPSIYWVAQRRRVPVLQTLHNFRLHCPQAMYLREGKVCEDCIGHIPWRGVVHGCYRGSRAQTSALVGMVTLHRQIGTWNNKVTRYIALNEFCRNKFIEGGLPAERIVIKPNFVDFEALAQVPRSGFLFVGRLSSEKGIDVLVAAHQRTVGSALKVAGTGPQDTLLAGIEGLEALGGLNIDQVRQEMNRAKALVLPSIWYENFPRTLVEAFGCGLPVIASRIGALAELVTDGVTGLLFEPGNAGDLAEKMRWAQEHPAEMAAMGQNARALYEAEFTPERNYKQLMAIYEEAINAVKEVTP